TPRQPLRNPTIVCPYDIPCLTTALMAALRPGTSPPPVSRPIRTRRAPWTRGMGGAPTRRTRAYRLAYQALRPVRPGRGRGADWARDLRAAPAPLGGLPLRARRRGRTREPHVVGRERPGVPPRPRAVPRRGRPRVGSRGAARVRGAAARPARGPTGARGRRGLSPVLALGRRAGSARRRDRRRPRDARCQPGARAACPAARRGRPSAPFRRRRLRRRLHVLRRPALRPGPRAGAPRGRARPAPGRAVGVLGDPPRALDVPRRPLGRGHDGAPPVLRPSSLRRDRRAWRARLRGVPPHARRPRAGPRRRGSR